MPTGIAEVSLLGKRCEIEHMRGIQPILYAVLFLGMTATAHSQESGDSAAGYKMAQNVCAECHAIQPGTKISPNLLAPPFQNIADTPGMTGFDLTVWSIIPHETMPDIPFSREEREDIIAYILSLKSK